MKSSGVQVALVRISTIEDGWKIKFKLSENERVRCNFTTKYQ